MGKAHSKSSTKKGPNKFIKDGRSSITKDTPTNGTASNLDCAVDSAPLHMDLQQDGFNMFAKLFKGGSKMRDGYQPLHIAAEKGYTKAVEKLLKTGASSSVPTNKGDLAIHLAVQNDHQETVIALLGCKADLQAKNRHGNQALHIAVLNKSASMVGVLIAGGANVSDTNSEGDQAIHLAASLCSTIIVCTLLKAGARPSAKNSLGLTVAEIAGRHGFLAVAMAIQLHERELNRLSQNSQPSSSKFHSQAMQGHGDSERSNYGKGKSQKKQIELSNSSLEVHISQHQGIKKSPVKKIQGLQDNQINKHTSQKTVNKQASTDDNKVSTDDLKKIVLNVQANSLESTRWAYHHLGDVIIPEICVNSINNQCRYEKKGCYRLHSNSTSQWQIFQGSNWINLLNFHSKQIEEAFVDVNRECILLNPIHPSKLFTVTKMLNILGNDHWQANFKTMKLTSKISQNISYTLRRLSTPSAAVYKNVYATTYEWYFLDNENKWVKYGEISGRGNCNERLDISSQEIEVEYTKLKSSSIYFQTPQFQYAIDLKTMQQTNMTTKKVRPVRRRPVKNLMTNYHSVSKKENDDVPSYWSRMKETDAMILVTLQLSSQEFREVIMKFQSTVQNKKIHSVKRVQSPFLWRPFKIKEKELTLKYGGRGKLDIQKLFHGTKCEYVTNICKENFDWRLHGSNVGQLYGRGAYFSKSANYASGFCTPDWHGHCFMFLVEVIVGRITKGDGSMKRPPQNPSTGQLYDTTVDNVSSPKIFVKYDKQEYCPLYIIEYT